MTAREEPKEYKVIWEIELYAATPRAAAEEALRIQRDPEGVATVFTIVEVATGEQTELDLEPET